MSPRSQVTPTETGDRAMDTNGRAGVADLLRTLRADAGLSLADLGAAAHVTRGSMDPGEVRHAVAASLMTTSAGQADTRRMTMATTTIKRSGPAIRAVLAEVSPDECAQFEAEFAQALARAGAEFDLAPAEAVLDRWWGIAVIRVNPLSEQEQAQLARAREGVLDGLWERDEAGNWVQL